MDAGKHIDNLLKLKSVLDDEMAKSLNEAIEALDKLNLRTVRYEGDGYYDGELVYDTAFCPCCNAMFEDGDTNWKIAKFCPECGQKLSWDDEVEVEEEK